ncbi:chemotaxis protein CheW [Geomonas agri]|uniref:chemotaxis protein CheW n=1 Tax=Geomonas agri TaxID=2873702 RepID=UPI001CD723C5|nr:chemotaxis protein CheW [Geomonas agri]
MITSNDRLAEFLTFTVGAGEYGVDILKVQEIRGYDPVTEVPNSPAYINGVINLRGTVIPIMDLRTRLQRRAPEVTPTTVVIVVNVAGRVVGMVADAVSDVVGFAQGEVKPPPEVAPGSESGFISGLAKNGDNLTLLIDVERLLNEPCPAHAPN